MRPVDAPIFKLAKQEEADHHKRLTQALEANEAAGPAAQTVYPVIEAKTARELMDSEAARIVQMEALASVIDERDRQDERFGEQNHPLWVWVSLLTEEVGELAQAVNDRHFDDGSVSRVRDEAVQVAAVAVAIIEYLDRGKS